MNLFSFLNKKTEKSGYKCSCCGQEYDDIPLCFGSPLPDYYYSVPPNERENRIELEESLCVVDQEHFFQRGRLTIPIINHKDNLYFDVWTSISEENFRKRMDLWENEERINESPYFGWLQTIILPYGDTLNLKTIAIEQGLGLIPEIVIIEEGHPLQIDQKKGITFKKARKMVRELLKAQHQKQ